MLVKILLRYIIKYHLCSNGAQGSGGVILKLMESIFVDSHDESANKDAKNREKDGQQQTITLANICWCNYGPKLRQLLFCVKVRL